MYSEQISQIISELNKSLANGTFAKLTMGKTPGKTEMVNLYFRTIINDAGKLNFNVLYRFQQEEITQIEPLENAEKIITKHLNNPFFTVILFTTEKDVLIKLNKKRIATVSEMQNTFKHADPILLEFLKSK